MKKSKLLMVLILLFLVIISPLAAKGETETAKGKVAKVKIQHVVSLENPWHKASVAMADFLNASDFFQADVFGSGVLSQNNWAVMFDQTQTGSNEIAVESATALSSIVDEVFAINLPFMFEDQDHLDRWFNSGSKTLEKWLQKFEAKNLKVLTIVSKPFRQCINNVRIIREPKDLRGLKFRIPDSQLYYTVWEAMGAHPVALAASEMYSGIQLGAINGQENSTPNVYDFKTHEVAKYMTLWNYMGDASILVMNLDIYNSLNDEQKQILSEGAQIFAEVNKQADLEYSVFAKSEMEKVGTVFYEMPQNEREVFASLMTPVYKEFEEKVGAEDWNTFVKEVNATR